MCLYMLYMALKLLPEAFTLYIKGKASPPRHFQTYSRLSWRPDIITAGPFTHTRAHAKGMPCFSVHYLECY